MEGLTKYYSTLLAKKNIRINNIRVGGVENNQPKIFIKNFLKKTPANKMVKKQDLANVVNFLCSEKSKYIIVCIGTPVDKKLNPKLKNFTNFFYELKKFLKKDQIVIIRSSIYPGTCNKIYKIIKNKCANLSYCPERIVQGKAISELPKLGGLDKQVSLQPGFVILLIIWFVKVVVIVG